MMSRARGAVTRDNARRSVRRLTVLAVAGATATATWLAAFLGSAPNPALSAAPPPDNGSPEPTAEPQPETPPPSLSTVRATPVVRPTVSPRPTTRRTFKPRPRPTRVRTTPRPTAHRTPPPPQPTQDPPGGGSGGSG
ncbi:MAG: hypothetical protein QOE64_2508 [Frankiales bacterium]|nr:hypothetical protein [Frankiales bacterium]